MPERKGRIEVIIQLKKDNRIALLKRPIRERPSAYRAIQEKVANDVIRVGGIEVIKIPRGYFGAAVGVRGLMSRRKLSLVKKMRSVAHVAVLEPLRNRRQQKPSENIYWALLCVTSKIEGLTRKKRFYFSVAVRATEGRQAARAAKEIAKQHSRITADHHFRRVVDRCAVLLVEGCETQWGEKKPDHLVMMRTAQSSKTKIHLKTLINQAVPL